MQRVCHERAQVVDIATQIARGALRVMDLRAHQASHPRLGVVDHVLCSPLGGARMSLAKQAAAAIGAALTEGDLAVPVYLCALISRTRHTIQPPAAAPAWGSLGGPVGLQGACASMHMHSSSFSVQDTVRPGI